MNPASTRTKLLFRHYTSADTVFSTRRARSASTSVLRDGVKEYNVQIYNEDKRVVMDEKRKTSELTFANNRVTFNAYVDLPAGKYYWRVRGRSDNSLSNWSAPIEIAETR